MATRAPPANPDAMLAAMDTRLPEYELYAIRYATREARRAEHFIGGDPHDAAMPMDYFVWLAIGPERTFVVDMGFSAEVAARRHREYLRCPAESLRLLGVDPAVEQSVLRDVAAGVDMGSHVPAEDEQLGGRGAAALADDVAVAPAERKVVARVVGRLRHAVRERLRKVVRAAGADEIEEGGRTGAGAQALTVRRRAARRPSATAMTSEPP